jgi:hypothetical protein
VQDDSAQQRPGEEVGIDGQGEGGEEQDQPTAVRPLQALPVGPHAQHHQEHELRVHAQLVAVEEVEGGDGDEKGGDQSCTSTGESVA